MLTPAYHLPLLGVMRSVTAQAVYTGSVTTIINICVFIYLIYDIVLIEIAAVWLSIAKLANLHRIYTRNHTGS